MSRDIKHEFPEIEQLEFADLFDIQEVQQMQDLFANATGIATIITQVDGTPITKPTNFCRLCNDIVRKTELGCRNCERSDAEIGKFNSAGPTIQPCLSAGLLDAGVSIMVEGKHIANWLIGQVRNNSVDDTTILNYSEQISADKDEFYRALQEVPVMSTEKFESVANMLFVFVNQMAEKALVNYKLNKQLEKQLEYNDELAEKKELLAITLNSIGDAVITTDREGMITSMNVIAEKMCGWEIAEAFGKPMSDIFHIVDSNTRKVLDSPINIVLETGKIMELSIDPILISKTGEEFRIANSVAPIKNSAGIVSGIVLVFSNSTEKFIVNDKIAQSERRYRKILANLAAGVVIHAPDSSIILSNPKASELLGLSHNQLLGKKDFDPCWHFVHESGIKMDVNDYPVNLILRNKAPLTNYTIGVVKSTAADIVWLLTNGAPLLDESGDVVEVIISFVDISERKKLEDVLIENEKYLNDTQVIAHIGSYTMNFKTKTWTSTRILDDIFGIDANFDKSFHNWVAIIHPDWQAEILNCLESEMIADKFKIEKKYKIIRQCDQQERWVHCVGELMLDTQHRPQKMIGVIQDITERERAEESLKLSERKYRQIFENVQDVYFQLDLNGIIREVSPSIKFFSDFDRSEVLGSHILSWYKNPDDRGVLLTNLYSNGELRDYEIDYVSKAGNVLHGSLNARVIKDENGIPIYVDGTIRDTTRRKETEKKLRESERKFHDYISYAPHGIFVVNQQGNHIELNSAASKISGYSEAELLTMRPVDLMDKDSVSKYVSHLEKVIKNGYDTDEFVILKKSGEKCYVKLDSIKIDDNRYLGYVVDITQRKIAEQALQTSENFLKETQVIAHMGTYKMNFMSMQWEMSDILKDILGVESEFDNSICSIIELIEPDYRNATLDYFNKEVATGRNKFDKKIRVKRLNNKEVLWLHVLGEPMFDAENKLTMMIGTVQDITTRKNMAEALRKSEALYRSILNASPDAIVVTELNGNIRMISPAAKILYGIDADNQIVGKNIFDFVQETDRKRAQANSELILEEFIGTCEYMILSVDGNSFYAEVNGDVIWSREGLPTGIVYIVRDISDRKESEIALYDSQQQIKKFAAHLQSVREEEKIMLAREIHDELGQILIALKIDMGLLKQNVLKSIKNNESEDILSKFDNIFGIVDNTIKTTRKIMTDLRPEVLYMVGFIEAVRFFAAKFEERNKIKCIINSVDKVQLDSEQSIALFRIFQEALTNVVKHAKATEVVISLAILPSKLIFEISDNGIGFKRNNKVKMDSYGLLGMQERVFLLDGELEIIARPGFGTKIHVEMPYYS